MGRRLGHARVLPGSVPTCQQGPPPFLRCWQMWLLTRSSGLQTWVCVPVQWEALGWMGAGLGFFALLTVAAKLNNKAEDKPFVRPLCLCLHLSLGKAMF